MGCDWEYGENSEIYPSIKIFKFEIEQLDLEATLFGESELNLIISVMCISADDIHRDTIHRALGYTSNDKVRKDSN